MNDKFEEALKSELKNEKTLSDNGAVMHATTGKALLDINFSVSSLRQADETTIEKKFAEAYFEDPLLAVKWLFFSRDVRGGMGERRLFRICFSWLAGQKPELAEKLLKLAPEYGRWDDLWMSELKRDLWKKALDIIAAQLTADLEAADAGKSVSLLAKWLPSVCTSSPKTKALGRTIAADLGMTERQYRKTLSKLRAASKVVEVGISANKWSEVDYNAVPSLANIKYKNAFTKHDAARRQAWLESLARGDEGVKINSSTAFPCDIVHSYMTTAKQNYFDWRTLHIKADTALEEMWKALPDYASSDTGKTLCVVDSSGSMTVGVGGGGMQAIDVAFSLGIYTSEKLSGPYKDKYISFSNKPKYIDMSNCKTLADKLALSYAEAECANTDLRKTMKLILDSAVNNNLKQEDLPSTILILSDMHFDQGTTDWGEDKTLMREIAEMYKNAGYIVPKMAWWNISANSRTVIPVQQMENGCTLVSGFSPSVLKMALSSKLDPFEALVDQLSSERYAPVEAAFQECV